LVDQLVLAIVFFLKLPVQY
jgi:hypothetical protein